ncbi:helix-turn-helix transcriptional regulator [Enterococcus sp. LJL98]
MKKAERLNKELIYLRDKHTFQLKELMAEFKISKSTALRDIASLETMGLALYTDYGRHGGYRLLEQKLLPPIYFDKREIYAIFFALQALELLSNTPFEKSYRHIQRKLMATLTANQQRDVEKLLTVVHYYNVSPLKNQNYLATILTAILNEQALTVTYAQKERLVMLIQVSELFYRNGIWFFRAYDFHRKKWGVFRSDFLESCQIQTDFKDTLPLAQLEQDEKAYHQKFHDIPFQCQITTYGQELFLKNHYPNMNLKIVGDQAWIVGHYNEEELAYMVHYLLKFGTHAKIEKPKALRDAYLGELQKILQRYD